MLAPLKIDLITALACKNKRTPRMLANARKDHSIPPAHIHYKACGRRSGLMVSALDSGASCPGSSPGRGHCVVFLGKTLYSHSASLHSGV